MFPKVSVARIIASHLWPLRYPPDSILGQKAGLPLASGYCGVLTALEGDLEYFASSLSLPRWSAVENLCPHCRATKHGHGATSRVQLPGMKRLGHLSLGICGVDIPHAGCFRKCLVCQGSMPSWIGCM